MKGEPHNCNSISRAGSSRRREGPEIKLPACTGGKPKRRRTPTSSQDLRDEVHEQVLQAAREIMKANVARAREGSLAHTKWLFSMIEQTGAKGREKPDPTGKSLAKRLLFELTRDDK